MTEFHTVIQKNWLYCCYGCGSPAEAYFFLFLKKRLLWNDRQDGQMRMRDGSKMDPSEQTARQPVCKTRFYPVRIRQAHPSCGM